MGKNLIIIGNGFDLHCGLKSKFSDFFEYSFKNNEIYKKLDINLKYSAMSLDRRQIYSMVIDAIPKFNDNMTIVDLMFILINHDRKIEYWNDFEDALRDSLLEGNRFSWNKVLSLMNDVKIYGYSQFDEVVTSEKIIARTLYYALTHNPDRTIGEIKINDFYNFLLEQLKLFEKRFLKYLDNQLLNNIEYYVNFQNCMNIVCKDASNRENTKILSFNYTNFSNQHNKYNLFNLHGDLYHNDCIIGIDDPSDNILIRPFTKSDRKSYLNEYLDQNFDFGYESVSNVYLYGHSFNKMDNQMYFTIFNRLKLKQRPLDIRFCIYYSNSDKYTADNPNIGIALKKKFNLLLRSYFKNDLSMFDEVASGRHITSKFIP